MPSMSSQNQAKTPITLIYLFSTGIITILSNMFEDDYLLKLIKLDYKKIFEQYELWRLITTFLYIGKPSPNLIFNYYLYYKRMKSTERKFIKNKKLSEFIMMLIYLMLFTHICTFIGFVFFNLKPNSFLSNKLMFAIILINSKRNPNKFFTFYLLKIPNKFVPYFLYTIRTLKNRKYIKNLISFIPGLAYYYLKDVIPSFDKNMDLLVTPKCFDNFCKKYFYPKKKKIKNKNTEDNKSDKNNDNKNIEDKINENNKNEKFKCE